MEGFLVDVLKRLREIQDPSLQAALFRDLAGRGTEMRKLTDELIWLRDAARALGQDDAPFQKAIDQAADFDRQMKALEMGYSRLKRTFQVGLVLPILTKFLPTGALEADPLLKRKAELDKQIQEYEALLQPRTGVSGAIAGYFGISQPTYSNPTQLQAHLQAYR